MGRKVKALEQLDVRVFAKGTHATGTQHPSQDQLGPITRWRAHAHNSRWSSSLRMRRFRHLGLVTIRPHFKVRKNPDVRMTVCSRHSSQESAGGQAIPGPGTLTCPWDELQGTPPLTCSLSFHRGSEEELKSRLRVVKVCTHKHQDP